MPSFAEDQDRQIVPRWRPIIRTQGRGELASLRAPTETAKADFTDLLNDWHESGGLTVAADLVSIAAWLNDFEVARDSAELVLRDQRSPSPAREVARAYLDRKAGEINDRILLGEPSDPLTTRQRIHTTRARLAEYPRNPLLWVDLALFYTILGRSEKAGDAMRVAFDLAPLNRHVLRSAVRMSVHQDEHSKAHQMLLRSPLLKHDPWIAAAEVAVATARGRRSENVSTFQRWIVDERFAPQHLTELASAISTVHAMQGDQKISRKLLRLSLEKPSENAVAQAAWLGRRWPEINVLDHAPIVSFEANVWRTMMGKEFESSLSWSQRWLEDQAFSKRPATAGSFLAGRLENFELAAEIARRGLVPNPNDGALLNNLAFALAEAGRIDEADATIRQIDQGKAEQGVTIWATATRGLVAFRKGLFAEGERLYREAIAEAERQRDERSIIARIYLVMELLRVRVKNARAEGIELINQRISMMDPTVPLMLAQLRRKLETE